METEKRMLVATANANAFENLKLNQNMIDFHLTCSGTISIAIKAIRKPEYSFVGWYMTSIQQCLR